uniref:Core-binding factor subunit beta n=1 Tax=Dicentrarchus labrax TaxID=13489 RepID=A0A8P4GDR5_DICLA
MPRVVPDQRSKFENEEFFRKLSRECEIKYTGFRDRPHEERQARFQNACRDGRSEVAFVATGTNLSLQFFPANLHGDQRLCGAFQTMPSTKHALKRVDPGHRGDNHCRASCHTAVS